MKRFIKDSNGKKHAVWFDFDRREIMWAGEVEGSNVSPDEHHYSYTHGGTLWRKACDLFWKLEAAR